MDSLEIYPIIFFALVAAVFIGVILRVYYRAEKEKMPWPALKNNMIGIVVLLLIVAIILFRGCVKPADEQAGPDTETSQ